MQRQSGFSLVELSVVIVVIGLIAGGIVVGRSLIRGSEQRAIISELRSYEQAFGAFIEQYQYPPGDLPDATDYWGIAGGTGSDATCFATQSNTTATCNGTGDGWVGRNLDHATASTGSPNSGTNYEWFLLWKQLANARLVTGRFSDTVYAASTSARPGYNVPASKADGGYTILMVDGYGGDANSYAISGKRHLISYGTEAASRFTRGRVLTPMQGYQLDQKIDDGMPGGGRLVVFCADGLASCATSATSYIMSSDKAAVSLWYLFDR